MVDEERLFSCLAHSHLAGGFVKSFTIDDSSLIQRTLSRLVGKQLGRLFESHNVQFPQKKANDHQILSVLSDVWPWSKVSMWGTWQLWGLYITFPCYFFLLQSNNCATFSCIDQWKHWGHCGRGVLLNASKRQDFQNCAREH